MERRTYLCAWVEKPRIPVVIEPRYTEVLSQCKNVRSFAAVGGMSGAKEGERREHEAEGNDERISPIPARPESTILRSVFPYIDSIYLQH